MQKLLIITIVAIWVSLINFPAIAQEDVNALKQQIKTLEAKVAELEKERIPSPPRAQGFGDTAWDPFMEMENMQREINQLFNDSFDRGKVGTGSGSAFLDHSLFNPDADIQDKDKEYVVKLDIPGMEKSNIQVEVRDHNLIVSGEKKMDSEEKEPNHFFRKERSFGTFSRIISLPADANASAFTTDYNNGVLTIKIPKSQEKSST